MKNILTFGLLFCILSFGCNYEFQEIEPLNYNILDDPNMDFIHLKSGPNYNPSNQLLSFSYETDYDTFNSYIKSQIYRSIVVVNGVVRYRFEPQRGHVPMYVNPNATYVIKIGFETREGIKTRYYESFEVNT